MDYRQLKLRHLLFFYDVALHKNFTKAAELNYTSQSNVSYNIRELEQIVGHTLLLRNDKKVVLTQQGELLLSYVKEVISTLEKCENAMNDDHEEDNTFKLAYSYSIGHIDMISDLILGIISTFHEKEPGDTKVQLICTPSIAGDGILIGGMETLLTDNQCDLGIGWGVSSKEVVSMQVATIHLNLMLPVDHPLADRETIALEEVCDERFSLLSFDNAYYHYYLDMFDVSGIVPRLYNKGADWSSINKYVKSGKCLSIAPHTRMEPGIVYVPIDNLLADRPIFLSWNRHRYFDSSTEKIRRFIINYFVNYSGKHDKND